MAHVVPEPETRVTTCSASHCHNQPQDPRAARRAADRGGVSRDTTTTLRIAETLIDRACSACTEWVIMNRRDEMKIGILGAGNMGAAFARRLAAADHEVAIAAHGLDEARKVASEVGHRVRAVPPRPSRWMAARSPTLAAWSRSACSTSGPATWAAGARTSRRAGTPPRQLSL